MVSKPNIVVKPCRSFLRVCSEELRYVVGFLWVYGIVESFLCAHGGRHRLELTFFYLWCDCFLDCVAPANAGLTTPLVKTVKPGWDITVSTQVIQSFGLYRALSSPGSISA